TGSMAAAYLVTTGRAGVGEALRHNLAAGPPSLEQVAFVLGLREGEVRPVHPAVIALSRVLDAPRRAWARLRQAGTQFPWKP
ncbi:MAG TPA: hypothetical protein VJ804_08525, partial [Acidimicrobiales bacterium]|nr:hypothetical protein [Acidimicrobiales bacterium]